MWCVCGLNPAWIYHLCPLLSPLFKSSESRQKHHMLYEDYFFFLKHKKTYQLISECEIIEHSQAATHDCPHWRLIVKSFISFISHEVTSSNVKNLWMGSKSSHCRSWKQKLYILLHISVYFNFINHQNKILAMMWQINISQIMLESSGFFLLTGWSIIQLICQNVSRCCQRAQARWTRQSGALLLSCVWSTWSWRLWKTQVTSTDRRFNSVALPAQKPKIVCPPYNREQKTRQKHKTLCSLSASLQRLFGSQWESADLPLNCTYNHQSRDRRGVSVLPDWQKPGRKLPLQCSIAVNTQ